MDSKQSLENMSNWSFEKKYESTIKLVKNLQDKLREGADKLTSKIEEELLKNYDFETIDANQLEENVYTVYFQMLQHSHGIDNYFLTSWFSVCGFIIQKKKIDEDLGKKVHDFNQNIESVVEKKLNLPVMDERLKFIFRIIDIQTNENYDDIINIMINIKSTDVQELKQKLLKNQGLLEQLVKKQPDNAFLLSLQFKSNGFNLSLEDSQSMINAIDGIRRGLSSLEERPENTDEKKSAIQGLKVYFTKQSAFEIISGFPDFLEKNPTIKENFEPGVKVQIFNFFVALFLHHFGYKALNTLEVQIESFKETCTSKKPPGLSL
jgi:hypothetical protein